MTKLQLIHLWLERYQEDACSPDLTSHAIAGYVQIGTDYFLDWDEWLCLVRLK